MTTVTVFRRVPPPIIGVCGVVLDRTFEAFEESLDWLETTGILVDWFDPEAQPGEVAPFQGVTDALAKEGPGCLPLILVDADVVSSAVHPTRTQLARVVGQNRSQTELAAAR